MPNIQAIIFDLYGTLIYLANDTKPYIRLFANLGLQTSEELNQARRIASTEEFQNFTDLIKRILPDKNIAEADFSLYKQEVETETAYAKLYPETKKVLQELKKRCLKVGLISNVASPYKKPFFDLGLNDYFDAVFFSCEIGFRKPDQQIYTKMIEKLKIEPAQTLMIGDNIHTDVYGSKAIGINGIHLDRINRSKNSILTLEGVFQYIVEDNSFAY